MNFWDFLDKAIDKIGFKQILSIASMVFVYMIFYGVLFSKRANVESQVNIQIVTALISIATGVIGYWLGSSSSSSKKDDAIINSMPPVVPANTVPLANNTVSNKIAVLQKQLDVLLLKQNGFHPDTDEYKAIQADIDKLNEEIKNIK